MIVSKRKWIGAPTTSFRIFNSTAKRRDDEVATERGGGVNFSDFKNNAAILIVIGLAAFMFFFRLGDRSFRNPDEGRYAEIAREMVQSGDWITPRLYGVSYLRKPILFYWLVAGSFKFLGFSEFAARAVPGAFGFLSVLAAYFFVRRILGIKPAFFSALLLASNFWFIQVGRYLLIDMVFTFFLVMAFYFFYLGSEEEKNTKNYFFIFFACLALAFLTKGLAALALTAVAAFSYLCLTGRFRKVFFRIPWFWGLALFLTLALPWFAVISRRQPHFLSFFFLHEHLKRFVSVDFEHQAGWYYYLAALPIFFIPWIFFWPPLKKGFEFLKSPAQDRPRLFLFVSGVVTILFYSVSKTKLPTYILPAVVFFAILIADGWSRWQSPKAGALFYSITAALCAISLAITFVMERVNGEYSNKAFAQSLNERLRFPGQEKVYIYDHPGPFYDFQFYLKHPVKLVGLAGELELSKEDPDASKAFITYEQFKESLKTDQKVYCLMRKSDYLGMDEGDRGWVRVLKEDKRKVLIVNQPVQLGGVQ